MTKSNNQYELVFLAVIPFLIGTFTAWSAAVISAALVLLWWVSVLFLRVLQPAFPKQCFSLTLVLWALFLMQCTWWSWKVSPLCFISLYLLLISENSEEEFAPCWKRTIRKGFVFVSLLVLIGAASQVLGNLAGIELFLQPAGFFLVFAGGVIAWTPRLLQKASEHE